MKPERLGGVLLGKQSSKLTSLLCQVDGTVLTALVACEELTKPGEELVECQQPSTDAILLAKGWLRDRVALTSSWPRWWESMAASYKDCQRAGIEWCEGDDTPVMKVGGMVQTDPT